MGDVRPPIPQPRIRHSLVQEVSDFLPEGINLAPMVATKMIS